MNPNITCTPFLSLLGLSFQGHGSHPSHPLLSLGARTTQSRNKVGMGEQRGRRKKQYCDPSLPEAGAVTQQTWTTVQILSVHLWTWPQDYTRASESPHLIVRNAVRDFCRSLCPNTQDPSSFPFLMRARMLLPFLPNSFKPLWF